jgi:hypothetical protein
MTDWSDMEPRRQTAVTDFSLGEPVGSFIETCRRLVTGPVEFFARLPTKGGYLNPLSFAMICVLLATIVGSILGFGLQALTLIPLLQQDMGSELPFSGATLALILVGFFIALLMLSPLSAAIGLFIGAGIYHVVVMLFVRDNMGYQATFRAMAYASIAQLVSAVPVVGIIGVFLYFFLMGVGVREMHQTTTGRAAAVVLLPPLLLLLLACTLLLILLVTAYANA